MSRGFLIGLVWGLVASGAALVALSLVAPRVELAGVAPEVATPEVAAEPAAEPVVEPAPEAAPAQTAEGSVDLGQEAAAPADPEPAIEPPQPAEPAAPAGSGGAAPPEAEAGTMPPLGDSAPGLPASEPETPLQPLADTAPTPDAGTMPAPKQDKLLEPPSQAAPEGETAPSAPAAGEAAGLPQVPAQPKNPPQPDAPAGPDTAEVAVITPGDGAGTLDPDTGLAKDIPGVTTNRLPRIGDTQPQPQADVPDLDPELGLPIRAYARDFQAEAGKPRFAILLMDIGAAGMARADLAKLPFAVTFVIDPAAPDAAQAVLDYRAAGQEVMILASGLPEGATPADLEQSFQSMALALPETVAVLDMAQGGLQENRLLATQAIPILKAQGRGIVTYDQGLGAADQVAQREGLAHATIFRELDSAEEATPVIRRYLDRAAFKAAQEGRVVVIGQTRAETVAAILEWMVEGRASSVQLAPITAVMEGS